jgi:hypothetical protein
MIEKAFRKMAGRLMPRIQVLRHRRERFAERGRLP